MAGIAQAGKFVEKLWDAGKSLFKAGGKAATAAVDKAAVTGAKLDTKLGKAVAEAKAAKEAKSLERFNTVYGKHTFTPKGGTTTQRFLKDGEFVKDVKTGKTYTEKGFDSWYKGIQNNWKASRTNAAKMTDQAAKASQQAASGTSKVVNMVGNAVKEGSKGGNTLHNAKAAAHYAEKATVKGWAGLKAVGTASGHVLKFGAEHPFTSLIAGSALLKHITGYEGGAIGLLTNMLGSDEEEGIVRALKDNIFGIHRDEYGNKKDVAVLQSILDEAIGNGTYDKIAGGLDKAGNELGNFYEGAKDLALRGGEEVAGAYNGVKERMANGYGNGFVLDDNGNPIGDPSAGQMPVSGGGNISNTLSNMLGNVTNGNISKLDLASLLASSYLMFGKFGWMGKATSLLLGSSTLHKINDRRVPIQEQGRQQETAQRSPVQAQQQAEEEVEHEYVHRYR